MDGIEGALAALGMAMHAPCQGKENGSEPGPVSASFLPSPECPPDSWPQDCRLWLFCWEGDILTLAGLGGGGWATG